MTEDIKTAHTPPSDFDQVRIVWKYELFKYIRSKRLVATLAIVGAVLALMYLLPPALGESYSGTDPESFAGNFIFFVGILIMIIAVLFAADSLVGEFQNRTGYLIFPNAIKRETLFAGKFIASVTVGMAVIALFYVVVAALSMISANGVDDDFLASFGFAAGYLLAATGIGYFISAIMKSSVGAIVLTLLLLLLIIPIVDGFSAVAGVKIEGSVTFASGAISFILMDPYPEDSIMDAGGIEIHNFYPTPSTAAIVLIAYAVVTCLLSVVIFKRKQLAG